MREFCFTIGLFVSMVAALAQPQLRKDNIDEVLQAMTLEEKASLLVGTSSDDGSRLVLDGRPVLDLDYDGGGYQEVWLTMEAGFHRLEIDFWDNFAEEYVEVGLKGPGISAYNLPADMLYHE